MYEKIFKTFVASHDELEEDIANWLKDNDYIEIDRSAPALTVLNPNSTLHTIKVAVTITAQKNN